MRRGQKFSNRPKRTHEERRLARIPAGWLDVMTTYSLTDKREFARSCAITHAITAVGFAGKTFLRYLPMWLKRAEYTQAYGGAIRRGKWAARAKRGKEKRADRAFRKRIDSGVLAFPCGAQIPFRAWAWNVMKAQSLAR